MSRGFAQFIAIDWSGARPPYRGIAVAACTPGRAAPRLVAPPDGARHWTRSAVHDWLVAELARHQRLLIGFDFAFTLPGTRDAPALWAEIDACCANDADFLGLHYLDGDARFWQCGTRPAGWIEAHRATEIACREAGYGSPETPLKLIGAKQVGKGALAGMRVLHRLTRGQRERLAVWPFDAHWTKPTHSVCVEIYPRLFIRHAGLGNAKLRDVATLNAALAHLGSDPFTARAIDSDHDSDALVAAAGLRRLAGDDAVWQAGIGHREGWIFGVPAARR